MNLKTVKSQIKNNQKHLKRPKPGKTSETEGKNEPKLQNLSITEKTELKEKQAGPIVDGARRTWWGARVTGVEQDSRQMLGPNRSTIFFIGL